MADGPPDDATGMERAAIKALVPGIVAALLLSLAGAQALGRFVAFSGAAIGLLQAIEFLRWKICVGRDRNAWAVLKRLALIAIASAAALVIDGLLMKSAEAMAFVAAIAYVTFSTAHRCGNRRARLAIKGSGPTDWQLRRRQGSHGQTHFVLSMPDRAAAVLLMSSQAVAVVRRVPRWTGVIAIVGLIACAIVVGRGLILGKWGPSTSPPASPGKKPARNTPPASRGVTPRGASARRTEVPEPQWNGSCPGAPASALPPSVRDAAVALRTFFEFESPLGPQEEGCLTKPTVHDHEGELYLTAAGINPVTDQVLSFAVSSTSEGVALFRVPAAAIVERLISELGPVAGVGRYPDYSVRAGDFYLVKTDVGIVVLLRESERSDYLELPATVATAWLAMMKTRGWLWPKAPLVEPSGRLRYPIWSDETPETKVGVISYDPRTREAVHAGIPYRTETIREIGLAELIYEAKKA